MYHRVLPLLVGIVGRTSPDLQFSPVAVLAVGYVETLVAKDGDRSAGKNPFLSRSAGAALEGNSSTVAVGRCGQALSWQE